MAEDGDGPPHRDDDDPTESDRIDDPLERTPRETVGELTDDDLTDLDEVEGLEIRSPDAPIERGSIDVENALFVILGVVISVLVFLEFLSVLPGA